MTYFVTPAAPRCLPILAALALALLALPARGWDDATPPAAESPPAKAEPSAESPKTDPAAAESAKPQARPFSWDLSPYEIQIWLHADRGAAVPETDSEAWQSQLAETVEVALGPGCVVRVMAMPDAARRELRGSLESLTAVALSGAVAKPNPDKVFLVACLAGGDSPGLQIREVDVRTWSLSPPLRRELPHRSLLSEEIARGVSDAFRPLARVERAAGQAATLLPRAGGLMIEGRSRGELHQGDLLRAYLRRGDRYGQAKPQDVGPIQWTYAIADAAEGRFFPSQVVTALREPLAGRTSSRVEKLLLFIRPQAGETTLLLKSRQPPHPPLAGYEIFDLQPDAEPQPLGITDGEGRLTISPRAAGIYRLHVRHGREILARLPLAPGAEKEVVAFLPDDGPRLDAEGFVSGLQETLIDTVARRQVAFARIDRLLARGEFTTASREVEFVRLLPTRAQLAAQLTNQQAKYSSTDSRVQSKIERLFTETRQLLEKYLDPQEIEAAAAKVDRARREAAAPPPVAIPMPEPPMPMPVDPAPMPMPGVPVPMPVPGVPMPGMPPVAPMPVLPPVVPMAVPPPVAPMPVLPPVR